MNGYSYVNCKRGANLEQCINILDIGRWLSKEIDHILRRSFNISLALLLLVPASLIMLIVYVLELIFDNDHGPFFYCGIRLGLNAKRFEIYKIRTLSLQAEEKIGSDLLVPGTRLERRFGSFLRRTRIDELPQLFNILKGDMNFVGPRPVRIAVSEKHRYKIRNYNLRFNVRPGLTGFSQFFTPHGTPKKIRAMVDNSFIKRNISLRQEMALIGWTAFMMFANTVCETSHLLLDQAKMIKRERRVKNNRALKRSKTNGVKVVIERRNGSQLTQERGHLVDISYSHLCVISRSNLQRGEKLNLLFEVNSNRNNKLKKAYALGTVESVRKPENVSNGSRCYVLQYDPISNLNRYLVDQYVMHESVA